MSAVFIYMRLEKCSVSIFPTQITRLENTNELVHSDYLK